MPELHPDLVVLAPLLGTWQGEGEGSYPTIEPFGYLETVTFGHVGKPFFAYAQRTTARSDGRPLHAEQGYLRQPAPGHLELVVAHPTGITEVELGTVEASAGALVLVLATTTVASTPTAKRVDAVERRFTLDGDVLSYTLAMAAVGEPMTHHLAATLRRQP